MVETAGRAGIEVRTARADEELGPVASDVCRVRDRIWVILQSGDTVDAQVDALARALVAHGQALLGGQFVPPAVRERIVALPADGSPGDGTRE